MKRQLVLFDRVSLDGMFSTPEGKLDWVVPDDAIDRDGAAGIPMTDTVLFGRKTYEMFASFWPHALDPETPDPHMPRRRSPHMHAMATFLNAAPKIVFSRTLATATWNGSQIVRELDPAAIAAMKDQPGKNLFIFGSGSVASTLAAHGLIDEYRIVVSPLLLGRGKRLFGELATRVPLKLLDATPYPSGNVAMRYAPA